jgi:hypothetical protein
MELPASKQQALVYTFQSGEAHNAFEEIVYLGEANRVLVLSAKTRDACDKALGAFRSFARSYRGSITATEQPAR